MPSQDCTGAVELFCEDQAGEIVGHCDGTKREREAGLRLDGSVGGWGPAIGGADGEDNVLDSLIAAGTEPCCEFGGGELASATVEEDREGGKAGRFTGLFRIGEPGQKGGF